MERKYAKICIAMATAILMISVVSAQTVNLEDSTSFKNHNFLIAEQRFNNTPGKNLSVTTQDEPLFIAINNETITISLLEWGDESRYGVIIKITNSSHSVLVPLERGWGRQVDEEIIGNLKIQIGLMEIFRGKNMEFVRLGIFITKN